MRKFSNKEPLGSDNNDDEEEQKTLDYKDIILSFDESYLHSEGLSTTH